MKAKQNKININIERSVDIIINIPIVAHICHNIYLHVNVGYSFICVNAFIRHAMDFADCISVYRRSGDAAITQVKQQRLQDFSSKATFSENANADSC